MAADGAATPSLEPGNRGQATPGQSRRRDVSPRRLLGAFYTPDALATVLTRWALDGCAGSVLDPSYGGCAFLRAAVDVLREQGTIHPERLVYGVDVDPQCATYARGLVAPRNHITADFLSLRPHSTRGAPFKAIVGNPPYVRHHWLRGMKRRAARAALKRAGVALRATASTWAYFVVHAVSFLAPGGQLAMLVPEAVLQADYATTGRDLWSDASLVCFSCMSATESSVVLMSLL